MKSLKMLCRADGVSSRSPSVQRMLNHRQSLTWPHLSGYRGPAETFLKRVFLYEAFAIVLVSIICQALQSHNCTLQPQPKRLLSAQV